VHVSLIISIFLSLILIFYNRLIFNYSSKKNELFNFLEYVVYYKVLFYMLIPSILRLYSGMQFELEIGVEPIELFIIYLFEFISYMIWLSVIFLLIRSAKNYQPNGRYIQIIETFNIIILIMYVYYMFARVMTIFGYEFDNLFDSSLYLFYPLVSTLGAVLVPFSLIYYKFRNRNNKKFYLSLIATIFYLAYALISGVRGLIIHPIFFAIALLIIFNRVYVIKYLFIILLAYIIFSSSFMQIRHLNTDEKLEILTSSQEMKGGKYNLIDNIEWRYGESSRLSVAFLRRGLSGDFAGIAPLASSLYAPIPRFLFPEKPIPGSIGEGKYSMGMYLINDDMRGQWGTMSEFYSSAHAYWEFGLAGVIVITILSGIWIGLLSSLFSKVGILGVPLIMIFFKPWGYNEPKIWLYDIPLQISHYIIPGFSIFFAIVVYRGMRQYRRSQ
jgi:hypothetical protein